MGGWSFASFIGLFILFTAINGTLSKYIGFLFPKPSTAATPAQAGSGAGGTVDQAAQQYGVGSPQAVAAANTALSDANKGIWQGVPLINLPFVGGIGPAVAPPPVTNVTPSTTPALTPWQNLMNSLNFGMGGSFPSTPPAGSGQ